MSAHGFTRRAKAQRAELQVVPGWSETASPLRTKKIEIKKKRNQTVVVGAVENWKTRIKTSGDQDLQLRSLAEREDGIVEIPWFSTVCPRWGKHSCREVVAFTSPFPRF
jgi:hypothetical protein